VRERDLYVEVEPKGPATELAVNKAPALFAGEEELGFVSRKKSRKRKKK